MKIKSITQLNSFNIKAIKISTQHYCHLWLRNKITHHPEIQIPLKYNNFNMFLHTLHPDLYRRILFCFFFSQATTKLATSWRGFIAPRGRFNLHIHLPRTFSSNMRARIVKVIKLAFLITAPRPQSSFPRRIAFVRARKSERGKTFAMFPAKKNT